MELCYEKLAFMVMILFIFYQSIPLALGQPSLIWQSGQIDTKPHVLESSNLVSLNESQHMLGWADETGALVQDHFTLGAEERQNANAFHMVVVGDSIAWGTGLEKNEKYYYKVADWLQKKLKRPVDVTILAHTGATFKEPKNKQYAFVDPELISWDPSISEQADWINNPKDVGLILLSGGINDVGVDTILNPLTSSADISADCSSIEDSMYNVLLKLLSRCFNSKIVVTSYYPIVSVDTPKSTLIDFVNESLNNDPNLIQKALASESVAQTAFNEDFFSYSLNVIRNNSYAFNSRSKESISRAVDRANVYTNSERVIFALVNFSSDRSYGTNKSWLWKLVDTEAGSKIDDHKYTYRVSLCENNYNSICNWQDKIDAIGHPNVEGAAEYAHEIESVIEAKGPNWLGKT